MFPYIIKDALPKELFFDTFNAMDPSKIGWTHNNTAGYEHTKKYDSLSWQIVDHQRNLTFIKVGSYIKYKVEQAYTRINKKWVDFHLVKIHTNGQTSDQAGAFHTDYDNPYTLTAVLFTQAKWDAHWGGGFEVLDPHDHTYKHVAYMPNTLVIIPSCWEHRGMAPQPLTDQMRMTLALCYTNHDNKPYYL